MTAPGPVVCVTWPARVLTTKETKDVTTDTATTGISVHFLATVNVTLRPDSHAGSRLFNYGDELLMTPEIIDANRDRFGRCHLLDVLHDDEAQIRKWGRRIIAPGPWPEGELRIQRGSNEWNEARERALAVAADLPSEEERRIARAKVREQYGMRDDAYSKTIATYGAHR